MGRMQRASNSGNDDEFRSAMLDLLRLCDFNASLLVPYFFPKYPDDKPMTLWERPHAISMMSFIPNGTLTVQASRQIGKCVAGNTLLQLKINGVEKSMTIEDLFNTCATKKDKDGKEKEK